MGRSRISMEGQKFGILTVVSYSHTSKHSGAVWKCECDCGNTTAVTRRNLVSGNSLSCGCRKKGRSGVIHGLSGSPEYKTYKEARRRCMNPKNKDYKYYGERGIEFLFKSFKEFYEALGPKPTPEHTIERKNPNGPYSAENCIWAPWNVQYGNKRKSPINKGSGNLSPPKT